MHADGGRMDMRLPTTLAFSSAWLIFVLFLTLVGAAAFHFHLPSKFGLAMLGFCAIFSLLAIVITWDPPPAPLLCAALARSH